MAADRSKSKRLKLVLGIIVVFCGVAGGSYAVWHTGKVMLVASAFYAKSLCSSLFVAGWDEDRAVSDDVLADMTVGLRHWRYEIDRENNLVTASIFGLARRSALYRPGLGCTLVLDTTADALRSQAPAYVAPIPPKNPNLPWPDGDLVETGGPETGVDPVQLKNAIDDAFSEPRPERFLRRTQAVVVVHKGRIVAERYAEGISPDTPRPGWSFGKMVMGALVGTLAGQDKLHLDKDKLFDEWTAEGDPRAGIRVEHLMRMVSGLDFDAPHARMLSDVRTMLFLKGDSAAYAKSEQLADPVGSTFFYASGSTALLASAMRDVLGGSQAEYFSYPWKALFEPLGMTTAVIEPDAAGTFLAPAFVHASARDWARFGQFYLQDGVWKGKRILPEGWVDMQRKPTAPSGGEYGAHIWLKVPEFLRPAWADRYRLPEDAFFMLGHDGQIVAMFPSLDLVVVRLGLTRRRNAWDHEAFLHDILKAFK